MRKGERLRTMRVLVTAVGGPTGLGIIKCLKSINDIYLIGTDISPYAAGRTFCDKFYTIPRVSDVESYVREVKRIVLEEQVEVLFPTLHDELLVYWTNSEHIPTHVALPISDHREALVDKDKLYKHLEANRLEQYVPRYRVFQSGEELKAVIQQEFWKDEYVCVKRIRGHGGIGFVVLTSRERYLEALEEGERNVVNMSDFYEVPINTPHMVMEYLSGTEYSVDVLLYEGQSVIAVPRKRNRVSNGIVIDGSVEPNDQLVVTASQIAQSVARSGFINVQFRDSENGFKLTDINPRFCGSQVMSFGAGVNFPYLYIQYNVLKERQQVQPRWHTRMVRYWESCFFYD